MNSQESITIKVAVSNDELIGKRVTRIKGAKYQLNMKGEILEVDHDRLRIKWDQGVRTWLKKDCIALIND